MNPGRNDPCPCGSGKKFKKCCAAKFEARLPAQNTTPTASELNQLVAFFNAGCHFELENYARLLIEQYPDCGFAWKALGALYNQIGRNEDALVSSQKSAALLPNDAEVHYNLGLTLLELGRLDEAKVSFQRALQIKPDYADAHFNLGNTLMEQGRLDEAEVSYRQALQIKPDYVHTYYNLGITLQTAGRPDEAEESYRRALQIKPDYAEVHYNLGNTLMEQGRLGEAEVSFQRALQIKPDYAEAHNNLGVTLHDLGRPGKAEASYLRAIKINPDSADVHINLGNALHDLGRLDDAVASYNRALEIKPNYANAYSNMGAVLQDLGQLDNAVKSYRRALEINPVFADAYSNLGSALMELGKMDEAEAFLNKAIELAPGDARPLSTALLYITYQQDDPRFDQLEAVYVRRGALPLKERVRLDFAMGKAMESVGQYDRSFSAYEEGNRLHYQEHPFDEAEDERILDNSCNFFAADLFKKYAVFAGTIPPIQDERVPIFIVGMLRSGSTLIEQILDGHPALYGAGELSILGELARKAERLILDSTISEGTLLALRKLGQEYLDRVGKLAPGVRYITDKMPGNYQYLGLIHLMLPNAKIIHSMRDPMDTCFSCYALRFTHGHEYSYDLGTLGRHYLRYRKLMKHWHSVLPPGRILDVRYEDIIADPELEARRLLDYLGLPWNPACLRFYETKRTVRTASVAQVRKPIYSSSVARWKRFKKHLSPLFEIIHPAKLPGSITSDD